MLVALATISVALAGPWVRDPGDWYVKGGVGVWRSPDYADTTASAYSEVGLVDGIQLVADVPYRWGRALEGPVAYTTSGLGSARVGVGLTAPGLSVPVSLHAVARVPLFASPTEGLTPSMGDDQVDVDLVAAAGGGLPVGPHRVWGALEGGYRHRTDWRPAGGPSTAAFTDGALYRAQLGWLPTIRGRALGWTFVELGGVVRTRWDLDTTSTHQATVGLAAALGPAVHLEVSALRVYAAEVAAPGWGGSVGISHRRDRPREDRE